MERKLVSIGGWCGPALILGKLGLRTEAYPFDFSRVTMDGVIHFIKNGFSEGFYPPGPPPFRPECVGIWVLFRGQHTAFAHFDLNDPKIHSAFDRKIERWNNLLDGTHPVTFFRTVTAQRPEEELALVPQLEAAIHERNPQLDFRTVVVVHDQQLFPSHDDGEGRQEDQQQQQEQGGKKGKGDACTGESSSVFVPKWRTQRLTPISDRTSLWALEYTEDANKTLFDRSQKGYAEIVAHSLDDSNWLATSAKDLESLHSDPLIATNGTSKGTTAALPWPTQWRQHNNIALIDGVASVGGTCIGIGSTKCTDMHCPFCGNNDYHKAGKPFRTNRPFTDEEDELLLLHLYKILTGGDKVEAVEQLAHEMDRGAFEVICRLQFLTNSSTKIAEGIDSDE